MVVLYAAASLPLLVIMLARVLADLPGSVFYDDPSAHLDAPPYVGVLSLAGGLGWAVAIGAALAAGLVLRRRGDRRAGWLLGAAAVSGLLAVDDTFLVHDGWLNEVFGVPEPITFAIYGIPVLWWVWRWRAQFLAAPDRLLLLSAVGFLGLSVGLDVTGLSSLRGLGLAEDGGKFLGIVGWAAAWLRTGVWALIDGLEEGA